jgi:hypothetical protein
MNRVALLALAIVLVPATASAYVREQSNWNPGALPVTYYVNQSTIPSSLGVSAGVGAVEGAFASWAGPSCTSWRASDGGNTSTNANSSDGTNVIEWVSGSWPAELGDVNSVIGITTPVWNVGGYFVDADIRFNNVGFHWNTTGQPAGSYVDAQSIATHEEGHFLGLDHTPVNGAIMYASYQGGLVRTLSSDDTSGVCAIYPSGVAQMDAGMMMMGSDPCNPLGNSCATCTPNNNCGWCAGNGQCMTGTQTGPTMGSCSGGYVWFPNDCNMMTGTDAGPSGTGRFGDPCTTPTDCGSGGLCVGNGMGTAFCSRACVDDCGCPDGYQCFPTSDPSIRVCGPGTRTCSMPGNDAGPIMPGNDAAVVPGNDAGPIIGLDSGTPGVDAGSFNPNGDGGSDPTRRGHTACSCRTAGRGPNGLGSVMLLGGIAIALARRRRRAA